MKFEKRFTPQAIADSGMMFSIPLYQRLFSWEEIQISNLLTDLYEHYTGPIKHEPYYLGQMTIVHRKEDLFDLIDGQQRFTVMILLAIVLKTYDSSWNTFLEIKSNNSVRLSFSGRSEDQTYILRKIKIDNSNEENRNEYEYDYSNTKMEQAITCIKKFINEIEDSKGCDIQAFSKFIFTHISFFFSELPSTYIQNPSSLNKYFEAMNSTGKNLENHEILKVDLMRGCADQEYLTKIWNLVSRMERPLIGNNKEDEDIKKIYREQYTKAIQHCIDGDFGSALKLCISEQNDQLDSSSCQTIAEIKAKPLPPQTFRDSTESSIISFTDFLLLVLDLTKKVSNKSDFDFYKREKLLSRFHDYKPSDIKAFYNNLLMYRLMLDFYIDRVEYVQGAGRHYLLFKNGKDDSHSCLRQYEAMLHVSTNNFYEWLKPLLKYIKEEGTQVTSSQLLSKLKEIDNSKHEFKEDINLLRYGFVDRYWFWRLDYYLWENRHTIFKENNETDKTIRNYEFRANRSIEHLHPQDESQNSSWKVYDLNSFGNLAMVSQSFNSMQSNDPVKVKFARIEEQVATGELQSLKLYHMYLSAKKSSESWTEKTAKDHEMRMIEVLKKSYVI